MELLVLLMNAKKMHFFLKIILFLVSQTGIYLTIKCVVTSSIINYFDVLILTTGMLRNRKKYEILRVKSAKVFRKGNKRCGEG